MVEWLHRLMLMWLPMKILNTTQIAKFMRPTWGPPGTYRSQMGPMLAPWTLLSRNIRFVCIRQLKRPMMLIGLQGNRKIGECPSEAACDLASIVCHRGAVMKGSSQGPWAAPVIGRRDEHQTTRARKPTTNKNKSVKPMYNQTTVAL